MFCPPRPIFIFYYDANLCVEVESLFVRLRVGDRRFKCDAEPVAQARGVLKEGRVHSVYSTDR